MILRPNTVWVVTANAHVYLYKTIHNSQTCKYLNNSTLPTGAKLTWGGNMFYRNMELALVKSCELTIIERSHADYNPQWFVKHEDFDTIMSESYITELIKNKIIVDKKLLPI